MPWQVARPGYFQAALLCYNDAMGKRQEHALDAGPVRYTVRIPPELYGQVARLADEAGWAVHSEVLLALAEHVRRRRRTGGGVRGVPGGARVPQTAAASLPERAP